MRHDGVMNDLRDGLRVMVRCDVVCVSACAYDRGLWMALLIGLVRRGGTGRGRFTNRPYGVYGRAERRGRASGSDLIWWVFRRAR